MSTKQLIEPMEFFKVDKISDDVYNIGPNVLLKFNVSLSKISNGKRYHYHKEYEYASKGISSPKTLVTIKRSFDYYLSIENAQKDQDGNKLFIRIGPSEYPIFMKALDESIAWFTDSKYSKLFANDNGRVVLVSPIPSFTMRNLPMSKYIEFTPVIIDRGMANADKEPGVRIYFSSPSNYIDINLDRLMGLHYTVSKFNMYQCALSLINYLQRPEFGTNRFEMDFGHTSYENDRNIKLGASGIEGRHVMPQGNGDITKLEG